MLGGRLLDLVSCLSINQRNGLVTFVVTLLLNGGLSQGVTLFVVDAVLSFIF